MPWFYECLEAIGMYKKLLSSEFFSELPVLPQMAPLRVISQCIQCHNSSQQKLNDCGNMIKFQCKLVQYYCTIKNSYFMGAENMFIYKYINKVFHDKTWHPFLLFWLGKRSEFKWTKPISSLDLCCYYV